MQKKKSVSLFSRYADKTIIIATLVMLVFGSLMIISAEMGNNAGDTGTITSTAIKQGLFCVLGIIAFVILSRMRILKFRVHYYWIAYFILLFVLLSTRIFGAANGAYAWIRFGNFTLQPSEFAKVFIIAFGAKMVGVDRREQNKNFFLRYFVAVLAYVFIIVVWQHDLGSGVVLFAIAYCICLIPNYREIKEYQKWMFRLVLVGVIGIVFILSPWGTKLLEKLGGGSYQIARFLASADPFKYQYDDGYHLIMSLVSFATGNLFGLGYGNSIHKYMNFPNPSTDFILPVMVEELGLIGFILFLLIYFFILFPIIRYSIKVKYNSSKMVLFGVSLYFIIHFILNVGGVSGLIPLTGVPILLLSYGGSSTLASLCALGLAESEIIRYRKDLEDENYSGQIQANQS